MLASMSQAQDIARLLVRELEGFKREIALFPDEESVWRVVPGVTNSAGNLALHVCGNLQHFVGACLGESGYKRDRQAEFGIRSGTRQDLAGSLASTIEVVRASLEPMPDSRLNGRMPGAPNDMPVRAGMFLLHLVAHTAFHLGQAGYVRRCLAGTGASSAGPLPLDVLPDSRPLASS
jgi:uncharacterized damage-inducible protein DinB